MNSTNQRDSIRLFENNLLESFTHVHPAVPAIMWGPFSLWLLLKGSVGLTTLSWLSCAVAGLFIWSFVEYAVHRWVFHYPAKSKIGKKMIFLFHGIHHDDPDDTTRLVMPPVPAIILMSIFYFGFMATIPSIYFHLFMGWFILGYLAYDYIHYGTHHWMMKSKVARYIKKYHLRHHHSKEASKYGVSNPLWDYLIGTVNGPKKDTK